MQARRIEVGLLGAGVTLLAGTGMLLLIGGRSGTSAAIVTAGLGWMTICTSRVLWALSRRRG